MGCSQSKVDNLQAVALCRDRYHHLDDAIRHRRSAAAHSAYLLSLRSVALSLHRFFLVPPPPLPSPSRPDRKHDEDVGNDFDECADDVDAFPQPLYPDLFTNMQHLDYARKGPPPVASVVHRLPPEAYAYLDGSENYYHHYFGNGFHHDQGYHLPPPPPPPAAAGATWEFLNPFEAAYSGYTRVYTPSWSSREVREREGIPDLEEVEEEGERGVFVKEMYGDRTFQFPVGPCFVDDNGNGNGGEIRLQECNDKEEEQEQEEQEEEEKTKEVDRPRSKPVSEAVEDIKSQFDRAALSCKEVSNLLGSQKLHVVTPSLMSSSSSCSFKMRYGRMTTPALSKHCSSQFSMTEDQSICSSSGYLECDEDERRMGDLSSTLQKLCVWEKKLHQEVKAEEKMRVLHDKKCKLLKHLEEKGAESQKLDSTRHLIRKLATKIRIAIQFIHSISNKLNKLRDDELWPQINHLIHGLAKMWQSMAECHLNQCQSIKEAKGLDSTVSTYTGKLNDAHMEATVQLVFDLFDWIETFCNWIENQRRYVKALNSWLRKCLMYEPEVDISEGTAMPPSPGKLGAPPIFVICSCWVRVVDKISEKDVVEAIQSFSTSVLQIWRQHYYERRQTMLVNGADQERMLKILERKDQKLHKALNAVNKRYAQVVLSGSDLLSTEEIVRLSHVREAHNLKMGLKRVCEAMEKFTKRCSKGYNKLCIRSDQLNATMKQSNTP